MTPADLPRRFVGRVSAVRDGLACVVTGEGVVWVRPVGRVPVVGVYDVDLRGHLVPPGGMRREPMVGAA